MLLCFYIPLFLCFFCFFFYFVVSMKHKNIETKFYTAKAVLRAARSAAKGFFICLSLN